MKWHLQIKIQKNVRIGKYEGNSSSRLKGENKFEIKRNIGHLNQNENYNFEIARENKIRSSEDKYISTLKGKPNFVIERTIEIRA